MREVSSLGSMLPRGKPKRFDRYQHKGWILWFNKMLRNCANNLFPMIFKLTPLLPPTLSSPRLRLNKLQTPPFSQRPGPNPTKPPCPTCCFTCLQCFLLAPSSPVTSNPAPWAAGDAVSHMVPPPPRTTTTTSSSPSHCSAKAFKPHQDTADKYQTMTGDT